MSGGKSEYTPEIGDEICSRLADGDSLRTICKAKDMPCRRTVFYWLRKYPEFAANYERAKEECADMYAEEVIEIADNGKNDWMASNDPDNAGYRLNGEHVQRSRVRVDTRKWIASKLKPKRYGDRLQHTGPDGEGPVELSARVVFVDAEKKPE